MAATPMDRARAGQPCVFLSRRMGSFDAAVPLARRDPTTCKVADAESWLIRRALNKLDIAVLPHEKPLGDDWKAHIVEAVKLCDVFIIFATDSYGEKTASEFCTFHEFGWATEDDDKTIAYIQMCGRGEHIDTTSVRKALAEKQLIYRPWTWKAVPDEVIRREVLVNKRFRLGPWA